MGARVKCVNIEVGMPTVAVAEKRMLFELSTAKREGVKVLKVIHGYGSTGTGGKLRGAIRKLLTAERARGSIKAFVGGEEWDIFSQSARTLMDACNELRQDSDLGRFNNGITIVLL